MSRTWKDIGHRQKKVLWSRRSGSTKQICPWYWEELLNIKKNRKITAKLERLEDREECLQGIEELDQDGWIDWYLPNDLNLVSERIEEFNIQSLTVSPEWGIMYEFLGKHRGFSVTNAWRWDDTVEVNLISLVREL